MTGVQTCALPISLTNRFTIRSHTRDLRFLGTLTRRGASRSHLAGTEFLRTHRKSLILEPLKGQAGRWHGPCPSAPNRGRSSDAVSDAVHGDTASLSGHTTRHTPDGAHVPSTNRSTPLGWNFASVGVGTGPTPSAGNPRRRRATPDCSRELRSLSVHAGEDVIHRHAPPRNCDGGRPRQRRR